MKTTPEVELVRLHNAEHWRVGMIANQLDVHPDVVRRVLGLGAPRTPPGPAPQARRSVPRDLSPRSCVRTPG
jgi:hypothetical protein